MVYFRRGGALQEKTVCRWWYRGQGVRHGSSRDWAAKGPMLLGVARSSSRVFETDSPQQSIGMGVLALQFSQDRTPSRSLTGKERQSPIQGSAGTLAPRQECGQRGAARRTQTRPRSRPRMRIDTPVEISYYPERGHFPNSPSGRC